MYQSLNNSYNEMLMPDIESANTCIICFESDDREVINIKSLKKEIKKCSCSGIVHKECINKWYNGKTEIKCIMCNTSIARVVINTRSSPESRNTSRPLSCKLVFFIFIITLVIVFVLFFPNLPNPLQNENNENDENDESQDPTYLQSIMVGQY